MLKKRDLNSLAKNLVFQLNSFFGPPEPIKCVKCAPYKTVYLDSLAVERRDSRTGKAIFIVMSFGFLVGLNTFLPVRAAIMPENTSSV